MKDTLIVNSQLIPTVLLAAALASGADQALPGLRWARTYGGQDADYRPMLLRVSPVDHAIWLFAEVRDASPGNMVRNEIWRIDPVGEKRNVIDIGRHAGVPITLATPVFGIGKSGKVSIAGYVKDVLVIVTLSADGQRLSSSPAPVPNGFSPTALTSVGACDVLLLGAVRVGSAVCLDVHGRALWSYQQTSGRPAPFLDAVSTGDGGLILLSFWKDPASHMSLIGDGQVAVTKLSSSGKLLTTRTWSGYNPKIIPDSTGVAVISGNPVSSGPLPSFALRTLSAELADRWSRTLELDEPVAEALLLGQVGGGYWLVGSTRLGRHLLLASYERDGSKKFGFVDKTRSLTQLQVCADRDGLMIASWTVFPIPPRPEYPRSKITLLRIGEADKR